MNLSLAIPPSQVMSPQEGPLGRPLWSGQVQSTGLLLRAILVPLVLPTGGLLNSVLLPAGERRISGRVFVFECTGGSWVLLVR
jgi:hypothetical protein